MEKSRIITDSASDLSASTREDLTILPLAIRFRRYGIPRRRHNQSSRILRKLIESDTLPTTSLVSPAAFEETYARSVADGETVIAITISSRLSGTYQSATIAAEDFAGKVFVIDSYNATIGEGIPGQVCASVKRSGIISQRNCRNLRSLQGADPHTRRPGYTGISEKKAAAFPPPPHFSAAPWRSNRSSPYQKARSSCSARHAAPKRE